MIVIGRDTENPDQSNLQCFGPQRSVERGPHTHTHTLFLLLSIFPCLSSSHTHTFSPCVQPPSLSILHTHSPPPSLSLTHQSYHSLCATVSVSLTQTFFPQTPHSYCSVSVNVSLSSTHTLFLGLCDISLLYKHIFPGQPSILYFSCSIAHTSKYIINQQAALFPLNTQLAVY